MMNGQDLTIEISSDLSLLESEEDGSTSRVEKLSRSAYERRRWPYLLAQPIYWLIILWVIAKKKIYQLVGRKTSPFINTLWMDGLGPVMRQVKEGAASWKALDLIYNYRFGTSGLIDDFWLGMINGQAVRNRLKLAKQEIRRAIRTFSSEAEVRIVSLACGSAEGVLEEIARFKEKGIIVRALLVDMDQTALEYAERLARQLEVADQVETIKANVFKVSRLAADFHPHVIEMLGLLDYLPQDRAIWLADRIKSVLLPGGLFLTCNIRPNVEQFFLKWVINWPMIYRTSQELAEVASQAGFEDFRLIYEPLRVHGLVIARK
jgi:hypothetical protein